MFRRRKDENSEKGNVCPYCEFVNDDAVENCAQCYYSIHLAPRDQPMATPSTSGSELLSTLMAEAELEEEEVAVEAVLSLEDVSVEIDQYEDSTKEENDSFQFISGSTPTLSKTVEFESPEEVELEISDAPTDAVVFDMGDEDPLGEPLEPVHTGLGKLYSPSVKTESDEDLMGTIGPIAGQEPSTPDLPDFANLTQPTPQPVANGATEIPQVVLPTPAISVPGIPHHAEIQPAVATPELPVPSQTVPPPETPDIPLPADVQPAPATTPEIPEVKVGAVETSTPEIPSAEEVKTVEQTPAPAPQNGNRIWPWPAQDVWDARQVYREVVALLEFIKVGQLTKAAETLDSLGPHLEHNFDMLLHIGSAMRALNREEHLQWTLAMAKHVHPNNEHVAAAVAQLS
jgi:hypothetical protein